MIELYGSPTPSTAAIAIMLEETNQSYTLFPVSKNSSEPLDLEFSQNMPHNVFPVMVDRDRLNNNSIAIFESGAILIYLGEKTGQMIPQQQAKRFNVLQWLLFENSKIGPTLSHSKHFMYHAPEEVPYALKRFNSDAKRIFSIIETQLTDNDYLAGDYSIADIATYPWAKEYERYGINTEQIPNLCRWLETLHHRTAVLKGIDALGTLKE